MAADKDKPRGRTSSYAFFVQKCREDHKKKNPNQAVVFSEFSKKCAEQWRKMSENEKKKFVQLADKDKKRYNSEMEHYVPPKGKGKKAKKDPNAPKRGLSAFFLFCNDERPKVKAILKSDASVGDIAKELGKRWKTVSDSQRAKYEAAAQKDKARYQKELTAYKAKGSSSTGAGKKSAKSKLQVESSESDDDEPAAEDSGDEEDEDEDDEEDDE